MEFHFLGTGAGVPSKQRNTSAIMLKFFNDYNGALWMFDCGEATQHRILYTKLKLSKLTRIFITHLHGDHIYGLPGVLGSRSFQGGDSPLYLYGPKGIKTFIETALTISETYLRYPLSIIEVEDGMTIDTGRHTVLVKELEHAIQSFGYRVEEKNKPGPLLVEKLQAIGVPEGPVYKDLKLGKTVTLEDGRTINGEDFVGPEQEGKKFAVLGDTRACRQAVALASGVDVLIHEATFMDKDRDIAYDYYHSTSTEAAKTARTANVSSLILTHISSRYQEKESELLNEARQIFKNTHLATDYYTFPVH